MSIRPDLCIGLIRLRFAARSFLGFHSAFFRRRGEGGRGRDRGNEGTGKAGTKGIGTSGLRHQGLGAAAVVYLFIAPAPSPPVWHTSIFDSKGLTGGSIPLPYLVHTRHTSHTFWLKRRIAWLSAYALSMRQGGVIIGKVGRGFGSGLVIRNGKV